MQKAAPLIRQWIAQIADRELSILESDPAILENWAVQLVNFKMGGAAQRSRLLATQIQEGNWQPKARQLIYRLELLALGLENYDQQASGRQHDLAHFAGVNAKKEVITSGQGLASEWWIIGRHKSQIERLTQYQTWLWSPKEGFRMILDFVFGRQSPRLFPVGTIYHGEVFEYPSMYPLRVIVGGFKFKGRIKSKKIDYALTDWTKVQAEIIRILKLQPWMDEIPLLLQPHGFMRSDHEDMICDEKGLSYPIDCGDWNIDMLSGACVDGNIVCWVAWTGQHFDLLGVYAYDQYMEWTH